MALQDGKPLTVTRCHLLRSYSARKVELLEDFAALQSASSMFVISGPWMSAGKHALTHTNFLTQQDNVCLYIKAIIISGILAVILNINSCVKLVITTSNIFQEQYIISAGTITKITGLFV